MNIKGNAVFFTARTGTGKERACVKVVEPVTGRTVQAWINWDGYVPENLTVLTEDGTLYRDPETGLIRSVSGTLCGEVEIPEDTAFVKVAGRTRDFEQANAPVEAFKLTRTKTKMIKVNV